MCVLCRKVLCGARSGHVTGVAEEVRVQGEALRAGLIGELLAALLRRKRRKPSERRRKWSEVGRGATS